ncbi:TM1266 family iron-only hydrogenase system putative regulator [Desulforamulus aeronauticus]|uniref:Putative iron-only hydrogenase system regulator n=1 Tax=Desulforamulus aeronauticus DSM 10349 TaxID=1121421 RepID=A0A1M6TJ55_9FIRM|nr:TM1266 family iron-only hydrogenase system putative regulator [Desulforamulus aeronauticus]SHK56916.1 putative iron-only hydrogenase system regulator [Desulforamulus aeronauticus DSM 10349]
MQKDIYVVGLMVDERGTKAPDVQQVITRFGSSILCRNGIPSPSRERGIITLTMEATANEYQKMEQELKSLHGVTIDCIHFSQPESFQVCETN